MVMTTVSRGVTDKLDTDISSYSMFDHALDPIVQKLRTGDIVRAPFNAYMGRGLLYSDPG